MPHERPGRLRHWWVRVGLAVGLMGLLLLAYGWHIFRLVRTLEGQLFEVKASYDARSWGEVMGGLAAMSSTERNLSPWLRGLRTFSHFPLIGSRVRPLIAIWPTLKSVSAAACDWKQALRQNPRNPLKALSPGDMFAISRALQSAASLPAFPQGGTYSLINSLRMQARDLDTQVGPLLSNRPLIEGLFSTGKRERYLVIFQDSGELRSTGGFMAAYGFLTIHRGHMHLQFEPNISRLDKEVSLQFPAPWSIQTYFHQRHLSLINANFNPNVPQTARLIECMYRSTPKALPLNGVIFVDSWLVQATLQLIGPLSIHDQAFTAQNFYVKSEYLAENRGLPNSTRMNFLQEILTALQTRLRHMDPLRWRPLIVQALSNKHLMVYANNRSIQAILERQGWAGDILDRARQNTLLVVNNNLGGLKDNYFMGSEVGLALKKRESGWEEIVTTTWTFSGERNGWLTGTYVGWVQCYLPVGTRLIALSGVHVHGVRTMEHSNIGQISFGTGILMAPRRTGVSPPTKRTLTWDFMLPPLVHPRTLHMNIQPGLPGQSLTYFKAGQTRVRIRQLKDNVIQLSRSN